MYLLDSNCTDAMTQESISGWQAIQTFQGGGLEPRLAYQWAAIPSGWEGLVGVRSGPDTTSPNILNTQTGHAPIGYP